MPAAPACSLPLHVLPPPRSTPFPYTTLFRSPQPQRVADHRQRTEAHGEAGERRQVERHLDAEIGEEHPHRDRQAEGVVEKRRSEEHTSELQSHSDLVCRLLLEKKNKKS